MDVLRESGRRWGEMAGGIPSDGSIPLSAAVPAPEDHPHRPASAIHHDRRLPYRGKPQTGPILADGRSSSQESPVTPPRINDGISPPEPRPAAPPSSA